MFIDDSFIYSLSIGAKRELAIVITSPEVMNRLAKDNDNIVRCEVARNSNTSPETLDLLANDENSFVRRNVAENTNTPPEALERLANDKEWAVRCRVAINHNTSPETLERLAIDKNGDVRYWVAKNPNYKKPKTNHITNEQLVALKSLIESASSPHLQELLKNAD
jgi:hypothetical protein